MFQGKKGDKKVCLTTFRKTETLETLVKMPV